MRVRLLKGYVHDGRFRRPGYVIVVSPELARTLLRLGIAEPETPPGMEAPPAPETAMLSRGAEAAVRPRGAARRI